MISSRRENQAESSQRPPRYLTSIKLRTAHHDGIQGRGVVPLTTKQIVELRSRQKNCWRWSDRRVAPDRFWQTQWNRGHEFSRSDRTHASRKILRFFGHMIRALPKVPQINIISFVHKIYPLLCWFLALFPVPYFFFAKIEKEFFHFLILCVTYELKNSALNN